MPASFQSYAAEYLPSIEKALDRYSKLGDGCPSRLREAMRYSLLAPGKRLRPLLVLMAADICGSDAEKAMPAACAVEMIHAYSLIHDDLPAMDDDDLRRGRPTCHKKFDEATAILAGDSLLTLAFEVVAKNIQPPTVAVACCAVLAEAAGACQLVGGQADDIAVERGYAEFPLEEETPLKVGESQACQKNIGFLKHIHRRKTGALISVSLRLGGLLAEADDSKLQLLETYGYNVGLAFQVVDDLLDVQSSTEIMGKQVGKDADRGKMTFSTFLGLDQSAQYARKLISEACEAIFPFGDRAAGLEALARFVLERNR